MEFHGIWYARCNGMRWDAPCREKWNGNGFVSPKSISDVQLYIHIHIQLNRIHCAGEWFAYIPMGLNLPHLPFHFACIRLDSNWSIFVQFALFVNEIETETEKLTDTQSQPTCCADKTDSLTIKRCIHFSHPYRSACFDSFIHHALHASVGDLLKTLNMMCCKVHRKYFMLWNAHISHHSHSPIRHSKKLSIWLFLRDNKMSTKWKLWIKTWFGLWSSTSLFLSMYYFERHGMEKIQWNWI